MKRKLLVVGIGALFILAVIIVIAGRGGWRNDEKQHYDELVVGPEGKLVVQPAERHKGMVVMGSSGAKPSASNSVPAR